jgi:hypothetical protein
LARLAHSHLLSTDGSTAIRYAGFPQLFVECSQTFGLRDRRQTVAPEPSQLAFDSALLVAFGREEALLLEHFREVVPLLDGDTPGRRAAAAIAQRLVSKVSTRLVEIPDGTQPDMLSADQIRCLCIPGYF